VTRVAERVLLRHRLEYAGVAFVIGITRWVPMRGVLAAGTLLGVAFYLFDRPHRQLAIRNLRAAFPLRSHAECTAIARGMFSHFGRLLTVLLKFSTMRPEQMLAHVEFEGQERVIAAHGEGRGVLLFTGHFGFWEINALVHALVMNPMAVLARPLDNPLLHDLLESVRRRTGNSVIYRRGAIRRVLRALSDNQAVAILIDQHIQSADAVYVDFFNRPAATTSALAALALRTGAPVVPVFALPQPGGRFRMVYEHTVPPPHGDDPDAIRAFTQRCTDVLEMYVRRYPDLWLWMHRRWRDVNGAAKVKGMFPAASTEEGQ
jgi:KDO2-lipid IV(A) lauroyltransferase